ncbi:MAG: transcriptional regulator, y4mF family [Glomeribacter sp. 1016415]|nr:transcriptional regulator, y4mF family [Glomeribacter sp. 1016415]
MTVIHTPSDLGEALRHTRKQLKLTQPQLALVANVGVRFLVELEAGKPTIQLEGVLRVIQALNSQLILTMHPSLESDHHG